MSWVRVPSVFDCSSVGRATDKKVYLVSEQNVIGAISNKNCIWSRGSQVRILSLAPSGKCSSVVEQRKTHLVKGKKE